MSTRVLHYDFSSNEPLRLDKFLAAKVDDLSRSRIQGLIRDGFVWVNQKQITKTGATLYSGDHVELQVPPATLTNLVPEDIPLEVVFENDDLLVINKPSGMVVHPSLGHEQGTIVHAVLAHAPNIEGIGGEQRPGVVHRLDKDTSGLLLVAKNERSHRWLQDQFRARSVEKWYTALVDGKPPTPDGRIETDIGRDPSNRKKMAVLSVGKGREAVSEYFTVQSFDTHTLLRVHLMTGRTHQIRVHMAFLKCPIAGDTVYGNRHSSIPIQRHFLHASSISFRPAKNSNVLTLTAELPDDLQEVLGLLHS